MDELGFVVTKEGRIINFGEYNCGIYRDNDNNNHFHNSAFRMQLELNKDSFPFIINSDNFEIIHKLDFMAKNGCVSLINATQGTFESSVPMAIMTIPFNLSISQRRVLMEYVDKIDYFDDGILYIDVIDSNGKTICKYNAVDEFYKECVGLKLPRKKISQNKFISLSMKK